MRLLLSLTIFLATDTCGDKKGFDDIEEIKPTFFVAEARGREENLKPDCARLL